MFCGESYVYKVFGINTIYLFTSHKEDKELITSYKILVRPIDQINVGTKKEEKEEGRQRERQFLGIWKMKVFDSTWDLTSTDP